MQRIVVTGGAGFIGSHVVEGLLAQDKYVTVIDNFSTGRILFIQNLLQNSRFQLIRGDLKDRKLLSKSLRKCDFIFHFAAHADIRSGFNDHFIDHEQNLETTQNVLEAMVENGVKNICFASSSAVYGDDAVHPTPENYPLEPDSLYGATKAACESYIHAYSSYYGIKAYIFRFVSFIGEHYTHGIIFDVLKKLQKNPKEIELLSDGTPRKSSIYVADGIDAIFKTIVKSKGRFNVFNLGHDEVLTVNRIVDHIIKASGYRNVKKSWLGKGSNWKGDNEFVYLDNRKIKALGWAPKFSIKEGIVRTVRYLQANPELFM